MKREDVKNKIPGITEEQLNWLMQENGSDIAREKSAATALQTQLNSAQAQLKTAQDGLKAFDGVDVAGLQAQVTKLKADLQAQADGFAFDSALNTAILGKKGRSVDAVRALLDLDAVPLLPAVEEYLAAGCVPGGTQRNFASYGHKLAPLSDRQRQLLCDPQTSGGLLVAVRPEARADFERCAQQQGLRLAPIGQLDAQHQAHGDEVRVRLGSLA